ncbi:MAG: protein kinase [Acidobacteria bacterium]|nr:protein kinase [Acidobacteriota bacterium]
MKSAGRSFSLAVLRPIQYLLDGALFAAGILLLVRFGLEFYRSAAMESLSWVILFRLVTDPVLGAVQAGLSNIIPVSANGAKSLPLILSVGVWILRYFWIAYLKSVRLRLEEPSVESLFAAKKKKDDRAVDMDMADSEQSREALLRKYRDIEKALKWSVKRRCTFLSIDVVGSTGMKQGKTQTDIAASFQAYEEMLRKLFDKFGAWKQAWTPDGVMLCFLQRDMAVGAAIRTLQSLKNFNATENRLGVPFKVRCGLNEGEVAIYDDSKLEKVADHVIDVAGHMQKHADENTVWLSEQVYNDLSKKTGFRFTKHVVDGYKVYEWALQEPRMDRDTINTSTAQTAPGSAPVAAAAPVPSAVSPPMATPTQWTPTPPPLTPTPPPVSDGVPRIGRYELLEEIGRGAMGAVYKARDPQIGRTVALKVILTRDLPPGDLAIYKERFYREARAAGKMIHPGIITVHDIGEDSFGTPYLVMEYVEGKTLDLLVGRDAGERMDVSQCLDIAIQVAEALNYAHHQGVVHRDIKPANILIARNGQAKIADFGVAKLIGTQYTQVGQVVGTPAYMSPEQLTGAAVDTRSDLFSFGVVLYWMLTGEKPFAGDTITAITYKVVHTAPLPPKQLNPALPADVDTVLLRCLAKNAAERYQSARELCADLQLVRAGKPLATAPSSN